MKNIFKISAFALFVIALHSCNSYPMDTSKQSDMNRNVEELKKREEAEKTRKNLELNNSNNFGKPENK